MAKRYSIIYQCYDNLTDALEKFQDNLMCDKTWVRVISSCYPDGGGNLGPIAVVYWVEKNINL